MRNLEQVILFDKYRIISLLGTGASGEVFLAEHLKLKTCRAIKRICKTHPLQSQFRLEAHLLKSLSHSSIPIIYDIEEDEEYIYIIEEYARGKSLQEYLLYHDSISQEYMMQIGIRLCDVFAYLHSRTPHPVCYKDLKPEHIIVCGDSVKIVDFGIASYIAGQGTGCQPKGDAFAGYGTVGYASPEQYRGEALTPASDLYALGKVLQQLEQRVVDRSKNLKRIIQKATAEDIGRRYASAEEFRQALERELKQVCQKRLRNEHLYHQIAVVGAEPGSGATHLAFAATAYLNRQGYCAVYQSRDKEDPVELLIRGGEAAEDANGICAMGYFKGILKEAETRWKEQTDPSTICTVTDFGSQLEDCAAEGAECTLLVIGGSLWEQERSLAAAAAMKGVSNLHIICNHSRGEIGRQYSKILKQRVYCFPEDRNPLMVTKEKRRLFAKLLRAKTNSGEIVSGGKAKGGG